MELGSHLASKLEPFLLISKSAKGAAAVKLIQDAISAQGVYFFAELLDTPSIKEVRQVNRPILFQSSDADSFSLRTMNSTDRIIHYSRYSHTKPIKTISVRRRLVHVHVI